MLLQDAFLRSRLQMLDVLLHREILRLRAGYRLSLDEFHGLYIGDRQVDELVAAESARNVTPDVEALTNEAARIRRDSESHLDESNRWRGIAERFGLDAIDEDILLLALAPEASLKYETLFPYLQNDVARRLPTVDLARRVLAFDEDDAVAIRRALLAESELFADGLLMAAAKAESHLGLAFHINPEAAAWLLRLSGPPPTATSQWDDVPVPSAILGQLARVDASSPPVILETADATVARAAAEAAACQHNLPLHTLDLAQAAGADPLRALAFRQRLYGGAALIATGDGLWNDGQPLPAARQMEFLLHRLPRPVFVHVHPDTPWKPLLASSPLLHVALPDPEPHQRRVLWSRALARHIAGDDVIEELSRLTLPARTIATAAETAIARRRIEDPESPLTFAFVAGTLRGLSSQCMGKLAVKIRPTRSWHHLVLPPATLAQLRDIAAAARHRHTVFAGWGLAATTGSTHGIKALFSGASGTGKTMSAEVLADDLGLDLYRIDLSSVVSKYIGETEKNLDRLFRAARGINAILFFDEADALFGKRSEVKDAHDRYANIEVSYLLQKMEEFDGIAILATNLSQNLDIAFSRRLNFTVDFPLPDEALRLRLWQGMFPPEAPLSPAADLAFLARQFRFTGGDIRNVALSAAFLAAADGRVITMDVLVKATARHLRKQGKTPAPGDFKQYHALIG